ncbi:MAG TPA: beta-ketoacyl-[acyl-carrier-protein] synthase family protein [Pyrinomonadaceae bacterium]|nr:beta-ketoacyl-[acyl-carrier-protein] synthase family protein [Pyrinomonadaceae bacterium]
MRKVVITGIGIVSPIGADKSAFWESLAVGRSGIGPITKVDTAELRFKNAAEVKGFDASSHFDERQMMMLDPFAHFGIVAAREAITDAGFAADEKFGSRVGIVTGSCLGGKETEDAFFYDLYANKKNRVPPIAIPRSMSNSVASHVSMEFGVTGATFTTSTACSSANHAIGQAFWLIRQGTLDAAIAGGSEAPLCYGNLKAWEAMRVVSPDTCRPFSSDRNGMILGEGGAMLMLETEESALKRGTKIYAEVAGFGMSADAHHLTMPLAEGAARAMQNALDDARLSPAEVGYINAHGTATQANDVMESNAIRLVFGDHTDSIAVSSTKSMHGHTLGAAGALEAAATVLGLHNELLPPTANFTELDPEIKLDVIAGGAREAAPGAALSNSFAFGGLNAVLAFRRYTG